ncbi:PhnD/SsuA/transferrin family substrate-binding protein [Elioraea sp.]|uniref:PhnD/SsuA/transferrin family substrate-binding protein n=1 Tax=Elioraea sp. TaxID=2185103 RepID=UPI0025BB43D8|nr:PhnD/SsuA/transferrin family substrate-binding protein [Elioraea sp.]
MTIALPRRLVLGAFAAALATGAQAQPQATIGFAVTDVAGLETLQREWTAFKDEFERITGLGMRFFPVNNRTAAVEALSARRIDFVLTGPAEYVVFRVRTEAVPVVIFSRPDYFASVVVRADSPFQALADLKGKRVGFGSTGSTSRHLAPMQVFADYGLDPRRDIQPVNLSTSVLLESLRRGDIAGAGMNHFDVARIRAQHTDVSYRVIGRGRDLPDDVLIAGKHVPAEVVERVRRAFVDQSDALVKAVMAGGGENRKYDGMRFLHTVKYEDFNYVRAMYRTIGQAQFSEFPGN